MINSNKVDKFNKYQEEIDTPDLMMDVLEKAINPDNYFVGPGDHFAFNMLSAAGNINLNLVINPTGEVLIPAIGNIYVNSKSLFDCINLIIGLEWPLQYQRCCY